MFRESTNGVSFNVKVVPRAKRNEIVGVENDAVKIRLTAPPVEGRANEQLVKFLAQVFGIAQANVEIVRGDASRHKVVRLRGVKAEVVRAKLGSRD